MKVEGALLTAVEGFFNGWKDRDWKAAAEHAQKSRRIMLEKRGETMTDQLHVSLTPKQLFQFEVVGGARIEGLKPEIMVDVLVHCRYTIRLRGQEEKKHVRVKARVAREGPTGYPTAGPAGVWGVNDVSVLREETL